MNCVECIDPDKEKVIADLERKRDVNYKSIDTPLDIMADRIYAGLCPICGSLTEIDKVVYVKSPAGIFEDDNTQVSICSHHQRVK